jgi:hypothetical protein
MIATHTTADNYFRTLFDAGRHGDAREESFYAPLADLVCAMAEFHGTTGLTVTTLPKQTEAGNPDFRVWDGRARITGYIEAKKPGVNLDQIETSPQLKRYLHTFPNVILTDFYEFRLYRDGQRLARVVAGQSFVPGSLKAPSPVRDADGLADLFAQFLSFSLPRRFTARTLAVELAKRTRFLREEVVALELAEEEKRGRGDILAFYQAFKAFLIADLSLEQFADLYAQTVTYGLFAARTRFAGECFDRRSAFDCIPRTIGLLRDMFQFISYGDLPEALKWTVDDLAEVLAAADVKRLLDEFYREGKGRDPIVHFYETFLSEYDPAERERRGVYYTPEPVVGYIVRSVHALLKSRFGKTDGLASEGVTLLDPAAGTMTFIAEAARQAAAEYEASYGDGSKAEFVRDHILGRFHAFELMMAPYAVGHLKMSFLLEELGYTLADDDRFKLYLTNTLEFEDLAQSELPGMRALSEESRLAGAVKKSQPVLVILGNPPYSANSSNKGDWIRGLIDDYKQVDGKPLGERNPKWLQDDYVKFLRFAQWKIDQAGEGIVAMITNHGYLDNPTFRGMRQSLMQTFDTIYILNLHGNSLKKETAPDGGKDENVFDIRQGTAICLMVKSCTGIPACGNAQTGMSVLQSDLYGPRQHKYDWLDARDVTTTDWTALEPSSPTYLYIPRDTTLAAQYEAWPSLPELMPVNSVGIVTARDGLVIDMDRAALKRRIETFRNPDFTDEMVAQAFGVQNSGGWKLRTARAALMADKDWESKLTKVLYRPFDTREICFHPDLIERSREEVMHHMLMEGNLALICPKQNKDEFGGFVSASVGVHKTVAAYDINYYFPLYLAPEQKQQEKKIARGTRFTHMMLFEDQAQYTVKRPNINPDILAALTEAYGKTLSPEAVFHYIYAVLYSPPYRERYREFLKSDFPRIPFTANAGLFRKMATIGEELVGLHLLKSPLIDKPSTRFNTPGDNRVAKNKSAGRHYDPETQRLYINATQYFDNISPELWNTRIGGYQVLDKWLKDRADRPLSPADVKHYCRTATALAQTLALQEKLTALYEKVEEETVACWNTSSR